MVILGIDPSLRGTGWGIIEADGPRLQASAFGVIRNPPSRKPSICLLTIRKNLSEIIERHTPAVVAIEGLFYANNMRTAFTLGHARGAAILTAAEAGLEIFEYAPRRVKQSVVGVGSAAKSQVGFMIRTLLSLKETPPPDAADALAIALTHFNSQKSATGHKSL